MKVMDVFNKLVAKAYGWTMRGGLPKKRKPSGVPGELVNSLSPEELEVLKDLRASDISDNKVPHDLVELFADYNQSPIPYYDSLLREEKLKFDKKIIK